MTARRGTASAEGAPGGMARHVPVLLPQVLSALALGPNETCIDGTFGAGGYTRAMLDAAPGVRVLAIDRDPTAVAAGAPLIEASQGRLMLRQGLFGELDSIANVAGIGTANAVVLERSHAPRVRRRDPPATDDAVAVSVAHAERTCSSPR